MLREIDEPANTANNKPVEPLDQDISGETLPKNLQSTPPEAPSPALPLENSSQSFQVNPPSPVGEAKDTEKKDAEKEDASDAAQGFWPVLQNRNFLTLWGGQVFSQLADKVYLVLMIAIIASHYEAPGQSISGWVSAVMIAFTIPAVLFGSLAGVYVDRWFKKPVLVLTNLLRGALVLILPILLWLTQDISPIRGIPVSFGVLLLITFLVSTLTQFFAPAEQSAIPLIVPNRHLLSANSLYTTTMMASVIIGFAVGEPLLAIADTLLAPLDGGTGIGKDILVGLSYGLAGVILLLMQTHETHDNKDVSSDVWADIKDGLSYLGQQVQVRSALIQLVLLFSIFAALAVLAVRLAEVMPALKPSQFGFLLASGGVGMGIGAALVGQFGQRFKHAELSLYGSLGMTVMLASLAWVTTQLWPSLLLIGGLGFFGAIVGIPMQTTIQEKTPEDMRGKVFGLQNNVVNIALSLPLVLAGLAETFFGLRIVFLTLAAIVCTGGILTWYVVNATQFQAETTEPS